MGKQTPNPTQPKSKPSYAPEPKKVAPAPKMEAITEQSKKVTALASQSKAPVASYKDRR